MHYIRPSDFVRFGIKRLLQMPFNTGQTRAAIAWLFGYTAHLVADYTIHPIVAARVGPYSNKKNRANHRRCEFDEDAYIFFKLTGDEVLNTDFLEFTGLAECSVGGNTHKLNTTIIDFWKSCLQEYPHAKTREFVRLPAMSLTPNIWYATYVNVMENFATKDSAFVLWLGCAYKKAVDVEPSYIENLVVPGSSKTIGYAELFEKTRQNRLQAWTGIARALKEENVALFDLRNGNLDTGQDEAGKYLFWD